MALGIIACRENVTAPGLCPEFCPCGNVEMRDTVLSSVITADSSYQGYRFAHLAYRMQVAGPGGAGESRGLVSFFRFTAAYAGRDSTPTRTPIATDSFRLSFNLARRGPGTGLALLVYRLDGLPDSATTWDGVTPFFADTALVGSIPIPDTLQHGEFSAAFPASAFPSFEPDSFGMAIGLRMVGATFVDLSTVDSLLTTIVTRYTRHDSAGTVVTRSETRGVLFDSFVSEPAAAGAGLRVGGVPAARVLLRASVPTAIVDSAGVVRATLLLVPAQAAVGAPGDTFRIRVHALGADFGAKSPLIEESSDTLSAGSTLVPVGSTDTLRIDVTQVLQTWRTSPSLPRSMMLRLVPEAASAAALDVVPSTSATGQPSLQVTYVSPYRFPGR
jgi:hypothetical protein